MAPLELRSIIRHALEAASKTKHPEIKSVELISPIPGESVKLQVETTDPFGQARTYTLSFEEH